MPIITLTTDFGWRDPYLAQLKGSILSVCPHANLIDVSHEVSPFDLVEAAYMINSSWTYFPKNTIHVCLVDNAKFTKHNYVCFSKEEHIFIIPNNGLAFLLFEKFEEEAYTIEIEDHQSTKQRIAETIHKLFLGFGPKHIGKVSENLFSVIRPSPVLQPDLMRTSISYIDRYGNAILNANKKDVLTMAKGRLINIRFSHGDPIIGILEHYHQVAPGDILARYNSRDYIEIAINMGRAAQLFGLSKDQVVQIEFLG